MKLMKTIKMCLKCILLFIISCCKTIFLKMKLMKIMKMCLKCMLLFIISCFREPDEKKIEVEDEMGIKRRKEESDVFILSHPPNPVFSI